MSRILIVEDDRDIRELMVEILQQEGHRTREATNGAEALDYLRSAGERTDLIILDLRMPGMDGEEFRQRQLEDPRISGIPVLLLSADLHARAKATTLGVGGFLAKPFDVEQLVDTVDEITERAVVQGSGHGQSACADRQGDPIEWGVASYQL